MPLRKSLKEILPQRLRRPRRDSPTLSPAPATPASSSRPAITSSTVAADGQFSSLDNTSTTALGPTRLSDPGSLKEKLWDRAYDQLKSQEGDIVEAYEKLLSAKLVNIHSVPNAATENQVRDRTEGRWKQMQDLVTAGLRKTEQDAAIKQKINYGIQMVSPAKVLMEEAVKACPQGAIAWAGVSCLLEILANPLQESASNRDGIIYVVSRMKWYWELVGLLLDESSQSSSKTAGLQHVLEDNITVLYQQLLFYQMKSICRYYRNRFVVFFKDVVKLDDWAGKLDDIKKTEAAIQTDSGTLITQDMLDHVRRISHGLETLTSQLAFSLSQIQENQDNKDCLRALFKTRPDDDMKRIMAAKGGLLRDSYRWILDHPDFERWQTDPRVRRLLITGDAGKGKTMLLCGIIESLKEDHFNRLCYFFCQATEPSLNNAVAVLRGLIYHLVSRYPRLLVHVREEYDVAGRHIFEDHNAWQVVSKILDAMLKDPCLDGVFVILDALDECIMDRPKLLAFINAMSRESRSSAKWIVSSRDWQEITDSLDGSQPDTDVIMSLRLTDDLISGAVEHYITHKVKDLTKTKGYMFDQETRRQVERHLRQNSGNTFLWVALVWEELNSSKVRTTKHAEEKLEQSPPGLNKLYERIIVYVCDQYNNLDADQCKQVLAITCVAQRLLTLQELVPLIQDPTTGDLSEKVEQLRTWIESCGSFLHLRGEKVYFVHQSAKDFLLLQEKKKRSFDLIFPSGIASQHYDIFSSSLRALKETLRRDIYGLKDPGILLKDISPPSPDPLAPLSYCCTYWMKHLTKSIEGGHSATALRDLQDGGIVHEFLKRNFLYWLEALSLSGNISQAVEPVRVLNSIIQSKAGEDARQLAELVKDAYRFLLYHRETIYSTPLQVYASALAFSPERSVIRQIFQREAPRWITDMSATEPTWSACLQTLVGHKGLVWSVAFSADSRWLASASADGTARIWDAANGDCVHTLHDEPNESNPLIIERFDRGGAVAFSPHSRWLAWGSPYGIVSIWDLETKTCLHAMKGHTDDVQSVAFSRDNSKIASASLNATAKIWDANEGICLHLLDYTSIVWSVAFSVDGWLATASDDSTVRIWNATTGECVKVLRDHEEWHQSVAFSPDGSRLVSGGKNVHVWDIKTNDLIPKMSKDEDRLYSSVSFSTDHNLFAAASESSIEFWDAGNGALGQTFQGYNATLRSIAFSPDAQRLASASDDGIVRVWDVPTMRAYTAESGHAHERADSVFFSADGRMFATAGFSNSTKIWSTSTGNCLQTFGQEGPITDVTFSTDNLRLASTSNYGSIKIWNTETGCCVQSIDGFETFMRSGALIANGEELASASSGLIQIWDVATGTCLHTLGDHNEDYKYESFVKTSTRGQWLAYSFDGMTIRLRNTVKRVDFLRDDHASKVRSIAFSADDRRFASASFEVLKIWDVGTGTCVQTIISQTGICAQTITDYPYYLDPCLSFDTNHHTRLHTRLGFLDLGLFPKYTFREKLAKKVRHRGYGIGFSPQGAWILRDGVKVLKLPPDHEPNGRAFASFMNGSVFVLVSSSGKVFRMRFSTLEYVA